MFNVIPFIYLDVQCVVKKVFVQTNECIGHDVLLAGSTTAPVETTESTDSLSSAATTESVETSTIERTTQSVETTSEGKCLSFLFKQ